MLTQKRLKELLKYDPETGIFTWLKRAPETFKTTRAASIWNAHFAGEPAGLSGSKYYSRICVDGKKLLAHRLAFLYMGGRFPISDVDHISGDKRDNRWRNLREATRAENQRNTKLRTDNKSGVHGVSYLTKKGRWRATIYNNSKQIFIGEFDNFDDAVIARKEAEKRYNYHPNHGRKMP
jgi:hypothetical protein